MKHIEAAKQALEALEPVSTYGRVGSRDTDTAKAQQAITALRQAIEQAEQYNATSDHCLMENAKGDLERVKLVQTGVGIGKPEQEPVAWADDCRIELVTAIHMLSSDFENALYAFRGDTEARKSAEGSIAHARGVAVKWNRNGRTSPPPRQPLTDEEIEFIYADTGYNDIQMFARAIEAAHGIKENT